MNIGSHRRTGVGATAALCMIAAIFGLSGCGGNDTDIHIDDGVWSIPVPDRIRGVAALSSNELVIRIALNGEVVRTLSVSGEEDVVSAVVNIPAATSNEITVTWFARINSQIYPLAEFTDVVTSGTTVLDVANYNSIGENSAGQSFDTDGDGRTNLAEAVDNRNLLSAFDLEVPRRDTFGGVGDSITNDGVDTDVSETSIEADDDSEFLLRHNGSELIVYVCGRDQTLVGDNVADGGNGQYWHDDTVFIYVDGADSDAETFDQVDDFQLAFVRSTEQLIVSKGPDQLCPDGDCVEFSFYQGSTECEYELDVFLRLNDFNIALDTPVGFDIEIVDDDDGDLREGSSGWIGFDDRSDEKPSTFGTIRLN